MSPYDEAARLIRAHAGPLAVSGGVPEEVVREAEERLGVAFPADYQRFLREFGTGGLRSAQIYGVPRSGLDAHGVPNGIWYTQLHWDEGNVARDFLILGDVGDGSFYALRLGDGEVVVLEPDPEGGEVLETVAPDFGTFVLERVREEVQPTE